MTARTVATAVPDGSAIAPFLPGAYFHDTYAVTIDRTGCSALELYLQMAGRTPGWVNALMTLRNRVVAACGGQDVGHLGDFDPGKAASAYRVGDRIGLFTLAQLADDEAIFVATDRHLDAWMSICTRSAGARETVAITTVVHVHNAAGRLYMLCVAPVHRFVVPALLSTISRSQTP